MNSKELIQLYELIIASLEGTISEADSLLLIDKIKEDKEAATCYVEFLSIYTNLSYSSLMDTKLNLPDEYCEHDEEFSDFDSAVWKALLETERTAPSVIIERPVEKPLVQHVKYELPPRKINKISLYTAILSVAALLAIVVFLQFSPVPVSQEVATLTELVNVKWGDTPHVMEKGIRLSTNTGPVCLNEGVIELSYDSGVDVTIEGPAVFNITTSSEIHLGHGRLYSKVSSMGLGFTVQTSNTRIIDLGTEFGVQVFSDGATELHVFEGKTALVAGVPAVKKQAIDVIAGQARSVYADGSQVNLIPLKKGYFAEKISAAENLIWRGRNMSLASLLAGGDGFSVGKIESGIDPATGEIHLTGVQGEYRAGNHQYHPVDPYQAIDGVFTPSGQSNKTTVSSAGHVFEFPVTEHHYWSDITASPYAVVQGTSDAVRIDINGPGFGAAPDTDLIFLHSNAGITFDLHEIRRRLPNLEIAGFKAICGVQKTREGLQASEFWVLLDGNCVFHTHNNAADAGTKEIHIPIASDQQFLTLAVTDGGDEITYDWCAFVNPELLLQKISEPAGFRN
jgi:hypothetical protein